MVRVAGLKRRIVTGLAVPTNVGRAPHDVLADISARGARAAAAPRRRVDRRSCRPALADAGIDIVDVGRRSTTTTASTLYEYFQAQIFPVLMPLAVDPAHPFPYISGLSLNLVDPHPQRAAPGRQEFARLKVPPMLPRFVRASRDDGDDACATSRSRTSSPTTSATSSPAWRSSSTTCSASPATRTSRSRRTRPRTSSRRSRRSCCAAGSARRSASRSPTTWTTSRSTCSMQRARHHRAGGLPPARPARPRRPVRPRQDRPARAALPARTCRRRRVALPARASRTRRADIFAAIRAGDVLRAPPVRVVRDERAGVPRAGGAPTRTCSPSSRRCTAPRATARSSRRSSTPPRRASRCSPSSRSRRASTSRRTSSGRASSRRPACTSSTASSGSRPTASSPS